ncbi:hypothetical protein [Actinomadura litoris]|nr:hypothetical protein [Actinomadura litoris]
MRAAAEGPLRLRAGGLMRAVFALTVLIIVSGLAYVMAIGLMGR